MMKHSKKILALAIAGALAVPQTALAAEDSLGMHYTSASEGFYGSLRVGVGSNPTRSGDGETGFHNGSRVGVSGSADLGGGMESYYTWELGVNVNNGAGTSVRLGNVGLRGNFGDLTIGSMWSAGYLWTYAGSDLATFWSGYNTPGVFQYRSTDTVQYVSPDLNGFQSAIEARLNNGDASGNDVDLWQVSAKYAISGFSLGFSYADAADGLVHEINPDSTDDATTWVGKVGYSQDNWYVNAWYGENNASDKPDAPAGTKDREYFGLGTGVSVNKVDLWLLHDTNEKGLDDNNVINEKDWDFTTIGVTYHLGSHTRALLEYHTSSENEDSVIVGLRHDF